MAGVNWYGFETPDHLVHGLWAHDYKVVVSTIKSLGYNVIRIPFSNELVESNPVPTNYTSFADGGPANTVLNGQTALEDLDTIVSYAGSIGLRVILDNHRSEAGESNEASGLWYTSAYPQSNWIADWVALTTRYKAAAFTFNGNPTVIGMDLRNEPHLIGQAGFSGACWTGDTETNGSYTGCPLTLTTQNWPVAAEAAGNAILAVNPNLLIFVEGGDCYDGTCGWQGGNLMGAAAHPVVLNVTGQLVYSAHDYGPNLFQQNWFNSSTSPASLDAVWNKFWGYISAGGTAPVWLGEFGTGNGAADVESSTAGSQGQWFQSLVSYLQSNSAVNWTYWAVNGEDIYALLDNNYDETPLSSTKQLLLASIQFPLNGGGTTCASAPSAPTGLTATPASSSAINLSWTVVAPPPNCTITSYGVFRSTTTGFTPFSSNLVGTVTSGATFSDTGLTASTTYFYKVEAVDADGASVASAQASATTLPFSTCSAVPSAPTVTATAASSSAINVSWTAVTPPANCTIGSYNVFQSTTSGFTPSSANMVGTVTGGTTFAATGLMASTTYFYKVEAVDADGASVASAQASATTLPVSTCSAVPSAPTVTATAASSSAITVSWTAVTPPPNCTVSSYLVFRSTTSGFTPSSSTQVGTVTSGTTFSNTGLAASTTYFYKVEAVDAHGDSASSAQASATTLAGGGTSCHVVYSINNQWLGGFGAAIAIDNTGSTALTNWTLTWTFANGQTITQLWNGNETQSGAAVTVTNMSYNGSIPAGGSYTGMGFNGTWNSTNAVPASFAVNGTACN